MSSPPSESIPYIAISILSFSHLCCVLLPLFICRRCPRLRRSRLAHSPFGWLLGSGTGVSWPDVTLSSSVVAAPLSSTAHSSGQPHLFHLFDHPHDVNELLIGLELGLVADVVEAAVVAVWPGSLDSGWVWPGLS